MGRREEKEGGNFVELYVWLSLTFRHQAVECPTGWSRQAGLKALGYKKTIGSPSRDFSMRSAIFKV